jgi:hypothetical protein
MYWGSAGMTAFAACGGVDVNHRPVGTPRERYDEYSSKFSLSKKPRFVSPGKIQTQEADAC